MHAQSTAISPVRSRQHAAYVVGFLFASVLVVLVFEGSVLNYTQASLRSTNGFNVFPTKAEDSRLVQPHEQRSAVPLGHVELDMWLQHEDADATIEIPSDERLHLSLLQAACLANTESIVSWTFGKPGVNQQSDAANQNTLVSRDDPELLAKLRQCPDVDIFLPTGLRGHGYCEDAIAYAKFLKSRLLPMWAIDTPLFDPQLNSTVTYHELCPRTPILLFNHYWGGIPESPAFPKQKPVYLMPNIEMYELNEKHYWGVDVVLCKTHVCYDRVTQWYAQEGNPRGAKVFYTRHTSSDVAAFARLHLGTGAIAPKDFENIRFLHAVGGSSHKGTGQVIDCWLSRPDFPRLDLFIHETNYKNRFEKHYDERIRAARNFNLTSRNVDPVSFGKAIAEAAFFLCTSRMEGYGHYINQARASGGVIVTPDVPPMNELISSSDMGVYVDTARVKDSNMFLGGAYHGALGLKDVEGMVADVSSEDVCRTVEQVVYNTTVWAREAMAKKAHQQYHIDTRFFARRMLELRQFAAQSSHKAPSSQAVVATRLRREGGASA